MVLVMIRLLFLFNSFLLAIGVLAPFTHRSVGAIALATTMLVASGGMLGLRGWFADPSFYADRPLRLQGMRGVAALGSAGLLGFAVFFLFALAENPELVTMFAALSIVGTGNLVFVAKMRSIVR